MPVGSTTFDAAGYPRVRQQDRAVVARTSCCMMRGPFHSGLLGSLAYRVLAAGVHRAYHRDVVRAGSLEGGVGIYAGQLLEGNRW